jgi:hypothetical protein
MTCAENQVGQAVDAFQKGGLTAPCRPKDGENLIRRYGETYAAEGSLGVVAKIEIADDDLLILGH